MRMPRTTKARLWCAAAFFAAAVPALGDPTRKIRVILTGQCPQPKQMTLVLKGDDVTPVPMTLVPNDPSHSTWTGEMPYPDPTKTFDAATATASLRLGGARTDCRPSFVGKDPDRLNAAIAVFTFRCNVQAAANVNIQTVPETVWVNYRRLLDRNPAVKESLACDEGGSLSGRETIYDVRFPSEKLILQIGLGNHVPRDAPGLRISDVPIRFLTGAGLQLDREGVVALQAAQRAAGNGSAPTLSSNAFDLDVMLLGKLENLQVKKVE